MKNSVPFHLNKQKNLSDISAFSDIEHNPTTQLSFGIQCISTDLCSVATG